VNAILINVDLRAQAGQLPSVAAVFVMVSVAAGYVFIRPRSPVPAPAAGAVAGVCLGGVTADARRIQRRCFA
jgi:hypothetical protein